MRNEGPFVLDWLAHLRAVGVSDLLVFSNDCDDGTDRLLDALAAAGALTHLRQEGGGRSLQWRALRAARTHPAYAMADWVLAIDCDEFPVPKSPFADLPGLIAATDADAIVLPWRLYGSSGHLTFEDVPVTERFLRAAPDRVVFPAAARFFKTLYRREAFARPGIHRPKPGGRRGARWVDGSGRPLPQSFADREELILLPDPEVASAWVQLNHYSLRSAEDFLVKRRRGLPNRASKPLDASYWAERNLCDVEDRSALRHGPAASAARAELAALAGVAAAHDAAVSAHRERIAELLVDPEAARLFTRLALLPASVLPDETCGRKLAALMQNAGRG